jgi:hypothetical protein
VRRRGGPVRSPDPLRWRRAVEEEDRSTEHVGFVKAGELLDHRLHEVEQRGDVTATVEARQQEELAVARAIYGATRLDARACTRP